MVLSSVTGIGNTVTITDLPKIQNSVAESRVVTKKVNLKEIENIMSTEEYVKDYFSDIPIMTKIAFCESTFRQLTDDGSVHRGKVNNADVGVMQINEYYHLDTAMKKGLDIYTIEGNTAYARDLYERQGTRPWNSSKPCWGKYLADSEPVDNSLAMNSK